MENKRDRCVNWEKEEKQILRDIIKDYLKIIENKDLSTNTNKAKMKAWGEISEKFNGVNLRERSKKQLMNQWKCMKLTSKKEISHYRREASKTGGGPKPPSPSDELLEVAEMIPQEFVVDTNEFDCDSVWPIEYDDTKEIEKNISFSQDDKIINTKIDIVQQSSAQNPLEEQTPKRLNKTPAKKSSFDFGEASYADMHSLRMEANERLKAEHQLRMKHMAEIHEQSMLNLKLQQEILEKTLENLNNNKN